MRYETTARVELTYLSEDAPARRALVMRIVASSSFAKSNRLSEFLKYVYALAEKGRFDDINEQNIGAAVFGRTRDYDPAADSIVRSHATRLRHRLREYFEQEGREEELILTIPRGSYIPTFEPRPLWKPLPERPSIVATSSLFGSGLLDGKPSLAAENITSLPAPSTVLEVTQNTETTSQKTIANLRISLIAAGVVIILLTTLLLLHNRALSPSRAEDIASRNPLWKEFIAGTTTKTVVVSSDSGLVMFEHLTGHPVSLASYISGEYLKHSTSETVPEDIVRKFGTRRYTPAIDLSVLDRITRAFGDRHDRLSFHYARDLRIEDLKQGNAVLLGTSESNPWVQLFEPSMNFLFQDDLLHDRSQMLNRHPLPTEALHYDSIPEAPEAIVYGIVAHRPNLQTSGHVLVLEGQTMAGTQTAVDFVFNDTYVLPFLKKIQRLDGSIPYFELLLRSSSFGGQSSRIEVVAYRVEKE